MINRAAFGAVAYIVFCAFCSPAASGQSCPIVATGSYCALGVSGPSGYFFLHDSPNQSAWPLLRHLLANVQPQR